MKLKLFFFPLAIVAAMFIFIYFIQPTWGEYGSNKEILKEQTAKLEEAQLNKEKLDEVLANFNSLGTGEKVLIDNAVTDGVSEEEFVHDINTATISTGARLSRIDFEKKQQINREDETPAVIDVEDVNVGLVLTGNYFQLKKALYLIENMNRFVRVDGFLFEKEESAPGILSMNVDLTIFYKEDASDKRLKAGDKYFVKLIREGMDLELIKEYKDYKGNGYQFDFSDTGDFGKEDLFSKEAGGNTEGDGEAVEDNTVVVLEEETPAVE